MARADTITKLPLDRWAQIMGINPLDFNQLASARLFKNTTCGEVWFQDPWGHSDRISRNDVARAIFEAESQIEQEVGYKLVPDWTQEERLPYPHPAVPGMYGIGIGSRGMMKEIEAPRGHLISGGVRTKSAIQIGATIVRTDDDTDSFQETCTVTVPTTVTDINEIRVYYPAENGDDEWEVRPIRVTLSGGNAIIKFPIWQIAAANQMYALNPQVLNAENATSFESTVDVYRVYNDPSTQVQFMWESDPSCCGSCTACQFGTQAGCFHLRDPRMGFLVPAPATWDSSSQSFTSQEFSACREPDQIRLWYYSGFRDMTRRRPYVEMSPYWELAVAYYAASLLDRSSCGCNNITEFIDHWRGDQMYNDINRGNFNVTPEFAANRLGTTKGAFYAFRRIHQNGVRINK